jgi:hypothetical protein
MHNFPEKKLYGIYRLVLVSKTEIVPDNHIINIIYHILVCDFC